MTRVILHLDMDAFFAAVEQRDHPEYQGKPVIVGADPKGGRGRGVVSTASYEARRYGIHSALPISQAYRLCPHGIYLPVRGARYQEVSAQIMAILETYTPLIEQISIDEAFLDLTGSLKLFGSPETIAWAIKKKIKEETGLTASIGIAPNKFVAKVASDLQKPDGLVIVEEHEVKDFLKDLPISKLWGVGEKTEAVFRRLGIYTIGQLAAFPQGRIVKRLGKVGLAFWQLANGIDDRPVIPFGPAKSVSQEITFEEDTCDIEFLERTLFQLSEDLSRTLRKQKIKGKTITLKIRLEDFSTFTRSRTLTEFTNASELIRKIALELFRKFYYQKPSGTSRGQRVRLLGIGVSQVNTQGSEQMGLFSEDAKVNQKLDEIVDLVEDKFGKGVIKKAALIARTQLKRSNLD